MRKIKHLIVHHSVSHWGDGQVIVGWHTKPKPQGNGWSVAGYHAVICNPFTNYNSFATRNPVPGADGRVDRILSETIPSNGCKYANANALHVCLIGDFDLDFPTARQEEKLYDLLAYWCKEYNLDPATSIFGHGEMQIKLAREGYHKSCPGKNTDMKVVRILTKEKMK